MKKVRLWVAAVILIAIGLGIFVYLQPKPIEPVDPVETAEVPEVSDEPIEEIAVADLYEVPEPKEDGTLVGSFGPLFPPGTIYEIVSYETVSKQGSWAQIIRINLSADETRLLAVSEGTANLTDDKRKDFAALSAIAGTAKLEIQVCFSVGSEILFEDDSFLRRGDTMAIIRGKSTFDPEVTVVIAVSPWNEGDTELVDQFIQLIKLGSQNPEGS